MLCYSRGVTIACRGQGNGVKIETALSKFYDEIGFRIDFLAEEDLWESDEVEELVANFSPVKRKGMDKKLKKAGIVL